MPLLSCRKEEIEELLSAHWVLAKLLATLEKQLHQNSAYRESFLKKAWIAFLEKNVVRRCIHHL